VRQWPNGTYVFTDRPALITFGAAVFAFSFGAGLWQRFETLHHLDTAALGLALGVGASVAGAFCIPYTRFTFDPARKLITWTTRSVFNSNAGQLTFDSVKSVLVQTTTSSEGGLMYRVALQTGDTTLPLGVEYTNSAVRAENLAASLRILLGLDEHVNHHDG
jgi:hypothetical protein